MEQAWGSESVQLQRKSGEPEATATSRSAHSWPRRRRRPTAQTGRACCSPSNRTPRPRPATAAQTSTALAGSPCASVQVEHGPPRPHLRFSSPLQRRAAPFRADRRCIIAIMQVGTRSISHAPACTRSKLSIMPRTNARCVQRARADPSAGDTRGTAWGAPWTNRMAEEAQEHARQA